MTQPKLVGLDPWWPWPLNRWRWWTAPVPAERLAALRIGVGLTLLLDVTLTYWPWVSMLFGRDSLGGPDVFERLRPYSGWPWAFLTWVESPLCWHGLMLLWCVSAGMLTLGVWPRPAAAWAWLMSGALHYLNPFVFNSGDAVRNILLFYLMLAPSGAVWTPVWRRGPRPPAPLSEGGAKGRVLVPAWPVRLVFIQMMLIYFFTGLGKLGPAWRDGSAMYYVLGNCAWMRWSSLGLGLPYWLLQFLTWFILTWEIGFPALVLHPWTRTATLWIGVSFHMVTGIAMRLGPFPLYMLCLYLPLLPWERWSSGESRLPTGSGSSPTSRAGASPAAL